MALNCKKDRKISGRKMNLIDFILASFYQRKWLLDEDITILEDIFEMIKPMKQTAAYQFNSIVWCISRLEPLAPDDAGRIAKLSALVDTYIEKHSIFIYSDTRGDIHYREFIQYHRNRTTK